MTNDVVLSSALRQNLLSLTNTQRQIDETQQRLATGLKVQSALDNPQNFFTAQSLDNRASDLSRLLDGISQSIRTIEEADKGVNALSDLIEQANSLADQAKAELNAVNNSAVAASNVTNLDLDDALVGQVAGVADGDQFTIQSGSGTTITIEIGTDTTANSLVSIINDEASQNDANVQASIVNGQIQISSTDGNRLILTDANQTPLSDLGFFVDGANTAETALTGSTLEIELSGTGSITANTLLDSTNEFALGGTTSDTLSIDVGADGAGAVTLATGDDSGSYTIDDFLDAFNSATTGELAGLTASFDDSTDTITITADSTVDGFEFTASSANISADFGQGQTVTNGSLTFQTSSGEGSNETLTNLATDYNEIRSQIDAIVADANFRGTNLLAGDDLDTQFNEDNSSNLTTSGVDFTSSGLGIDAADFSTSTTIQASIDQTRDALEEVRRFGSSIANDLSIIQTRQTFTEETIRTLEAGADDLTVADQNEEGAKLLSLQTRQQLATTSLSLAAQSQQAVLRLF